MRDGRLIGRTNGALAAFALLLLPSIARGEVALNGPDGCSDVVKFRARVNELLPKDATLPTAVVLVEERAPGLHASVRIAGAAPRTFEGESCGALLEAVALVLAMGAKPPPTATVEPTPSPSKEGTAREPGTAPPPPREAAVTIAAEGTAAVGPLPGTAIGGGVAVGLDVGLLRAEARGSMYGGQHARVAGTSDGRVDLALASVGARTCLALPLGPVRFGPCASVDLLFFSAVGQGVAGATSDGTRALAASAGGFLVWPFGGAVSARAGLEAGIVPSTNAFAVNPTGTVHEAAAGLGKASIGLEVRL